MALTYVKASGIDSTGSYTMGNLTVSANLSVANVNVTGPTTFSNISLAGNIIPTAANTYSLGSATYYFKDAYIGPGSLYIDGQKVMQSVSNTIVVSADLNQTLKLSTSGSGDIQIDPTGTGVIAIKGPMQIEAGSNITSSDGSAIRFTNSVSVDTITSVTTNTDLTLSGAGTGTVKVNDDLVVTGNITVQGSTGNLSVGTLSVEDNIIDISAETTGTPSNNAGLRVVRGDSPATQLRWYETGAVWQITNDGTNYLTIVGKDANGNISVGNITGTLVTGAQPNITSLGTLSSLTSGLITATTGGIKVGNIQDPSGTNTISLSSGNISVTSNVTASYFIGNGSSLTGQVGNALVAGTVYTNAQPNITSVGTLTSLTSGTITISANANIAMSGSLSQIAGGNLVSASYLAGTLTTGAQPNITSTGTLTSVTVTGNISSGNANLGNLVTSNYFSGNGSLLTGIPSATTAATVTTAAQPNITSLGTLSGLTVSGIISTNNTTELRASPTISAGTLTIDLNSGTIFDVALNAAITTLTVSNVQSSGRTSSFVLVFTADGTARAVTWPASFRWTAGNTAPTLTSTNAKRDVFTFFTIDGGTSWQAFISGQNI